MAKFYAGQQGLKTRGGHDVKIYEVCEDVIHGDYLGPGRLWEPLTWKSDGSRFASPSILDIIAPVETVVRYVNVHYNGLPKPWESLDFCERFAGSNPDVIARWKITYEPDNPEKPPMVEVIWSKDK